MKIKVNGKETELELSKDNALLSKTLELMGYRANTIIVELNNLIINSESWDNVFLKEGDSLENVSIVGGG